jgi:pimeloyl-ACP methyl ester carboxylesterase
VSRAEAARWREQGVDLAGYTTVESADDLDALRTHLGYDQIALWGESYGTHLALATIRRHGGHVARAVLIGPEGPDHTIKLPSNAQDGLRRVGALLAADPEWSGRIPDLPALVETVLDRLEAEPVVVDVGGQRVGISRFDAQWMLANWLGSTRGGIDYIPAVLLAMERGEYGPFAEQLLEQRGEFGVGSAMSWVMDSASGVSKARAARIAKEARTCLLGDAIDFPFPQVAEAWGAPDLGDAYRSPLRSDIPILFITGDLDSRTPVRNAEELMQTLPHAQLIVVENAAHDLNWVQTELREAWSAFLGGGEVELTRRAAGVRCCSFATSTRHSRRRARTSPPGTKSSSRSRARRGASRLSRPRASARSGRRSPASRGGRSFRACGRSSS